MEIKDAIFVASMTLLSSAISAGLTGYITYQVAIKAQEHDDLRALHRLAYESAVEEWKVRAGQAKNGSIPVFGDILLEHLEHSYVVRRYGADKKSEDYAGIILDKMLEEYSDRHDESHDESKPHECTESSKQAGEKNENRERHALNKENFDYGYRGTESDAPQTAVQHIRTKAIKIPHFFLPVKLFLDYLCRHTKLHEKSIECPDKPSHVDQESKDWQWHPRGKAKPE